MLITNNTYPLVLTNSLLLNMAIELVSFPMKDDFMYYIPLYIYIYTNAVTHFFQRLGIYPQDMAICRDL